MNFYKTTMTEDGLPLFALDVEGAQLLMSRDEAEQLFVDIGHTLQDDDVERYSDESMSGDQPND